METCLAAEGLSVVRGMNKLVKFGLHILSWNVGTASPPDDVGDLLHLAGQSQEPDMYVIGLQELNSKLSSFLVDLAFSDPWTILFTNSLAPLGYVKITSIRMQGVLLLVFVKCSHLPYIRDLETNYTRTGMFGYWGNKGGVTVRLSVYGHLICFLNCHLPAHIENTSQRLDSFERILELQQFTGSRAETILNHDLVFWFGDLNFRIADHGLHFIRETISKKCYHLLWDKDQLNRAKKTEPMLNGFLEGELQFTPTYKFNLASTEYNMSGKKRKPAWTDRILWRLKECSEAGGSEPPTSDPKKTISVILNTYNSQMQYGISDHKPVVGTFSLEVRMAGRPQANGIGMGTVQESRPSSEKCGWGQLWLDSLGGVRCKTGFESVVSWECHPLGLLFQVGFRCHTDYVTYLWVKDDELMVSDDVYQVYLNGEEIPSSGGEFLLCYYSSNMETIVGVSCPFQILPECADGQLEIGNGMDVSCDNPAHGQMDTC
ncbi:inositol polyphosphate 5-phosphatase Ka [Rhincodon typus]|uniref:inositol polyphosphate 5-phosphatase Ka n=1 Tax=Rhincodon typus TaxID=259920 RepID=UPI00202DDDB8|nr:inositol polyphosphate 5-phosphatase Ka [Rhincodon typus]